MEPTNLLNPGFGMPPEEAVTRIADTFKHAALTALFRTLLHQLMTAQIRVHALDLSEMPDDV